MMSSTCPAVSPGKEERRELPTRRSLVQGTTNKAPWNSYGVCAGIWFVDQVFRNVEDMYYQHLDGHLDPRVWHEFEVAMRDINGYPGVQAWWRSRSHWFTEEFAKLINQQQQTAKAPRLYREESTDQ